MSSPAAPREATGEGSRWPTREAAAAEGMLLAYWAAQDPGRTALVWREGRSSFGELNAQANQLARALGRQGLGAGSALALLCGNRPAFVVTVFASQRAGLRLTPINWHLQAEEVAYILGDCEAQVVVTDPERLPVALAAARRTGRAPRVWCDGLEAALAAGTLSAEDLGPAVAEGILADLEGVLAAEDGSDLADPVAGSTMLYTSGTTGRPKGVERPPAAQGSVTANLYGYRSDGSDLHLCTGPLYHAAPLAFSLAAPFAYGVGVVLMERFEPRRTLELIEAERVTHTHMVPTMFHRLLQLPEEERRAFDLGSLRFVLHGAAPCPVHVKRRMIEWLGPVIWEYYAATEGFGTLVDSTTWLARPGTVGRPVLPDGVVILDEEGRRVPPRTVGQVYVYAPPQARFQYHGDPQKTQGAFRGDYFTLGDVGYLDEDGYLFLTDRSADLVISGGVNIYPAEVDGVLLEHPAVADAASVGLPDEEWGEVLVSVLELRPEHPAAAELAARAGAGDPGPYEAPAELAEEVVAFCRSRLAHYKCPRRVFLVARLPRQDNGKLYRRHVRQQLQERLAGEPALRPPSP
ncbi:AMP-binding protein [Aciditerrimonas ferrireducens]|nr:AMP-binding protein [Aciditerrimonas ferrireducens]MCK4176012.1 AMP-binding protein [Aciditerrimonas ferrireducens]